MKKMIYCSALLMTIAVLFSGCGNAIPEMNDEERNMVVNYAVDIVHKYDSNHPIKLQTVESVSEEPVQEDQTVPDEIQAENMFADDQKPETEVIDHSAESDITPEAALGSFLQSDAFSFSYEGYETDDSYPQSGTEAYFAMNATAGNELLVLKFAVRNNSLSEETLDMIQKGVRFKIQVNGETKNALTTMLLNDFSNYQGIIEAGGSEELVVVCEIPKEQINSITSLKLIVKNADETATISLD